MRIGVTATGPALDAMVDPRFGRCSYLVVVETDTSSFEAFENKSAALSGGAGIQSARLMAQKGVKVALTGKCGPNAHRTLTSAGIQLVVGCTGTVADTIHRFQAGELQPTEEANAAPHEGSAGGRP